ncbi:DUF4296 domain-containing protein [Arcticibacter sp.]|uniref:DUF4296 domain-containing protein n=1 Tax=Arcticibacter sp. TaxID=1872630 RepID=UPI00388CF472
MKRLLLLFFIIIFLNACKSDDRPKGILGKEEMIDVLTNVHLADGYASSLYTDSSRNKIAALYGAIYKKHNTDSIGIRKSLEYYSRNPAELKLMYETIIRNLENLEKEQRAIEEKKQQEELDKYNKEQQLIARKLKLKNDSLRNDSLNKQYIKIDTFKVIPIKKWTFQEMLQREKTKKQDSLRRDSLMKAKVKE